MSKLESRELKSKRPTVIKMSKLNDVTGNYNFVQGAFDLVLEATKKPWMKELKEKPYCFSTDFAVSPDKTAVIEVNPNMEVTANFEVIEEKPEQKLLAEGK